MSNLFRWGDFKLHSGAAALFKIDCDALTVQDWEVIARLTISVEPRFGEVRGVPTGGVKMAAALRPWATHEPHDPLLIVDDVCTTGNSMETFRAGREAVGVVLFARGPTPPWVTALFRMGIEEPR